MNRLPALCVLLVTAAPFVGKVETETLPYQNPKLSVEDRLDDLLPRLTHEEQLRLLSGLNFTTCPIERFVVTANQRRTDQGNYNVEIGAPSRTSARTLDFPLPPTPPSRCRNRKIGRNPWSQFTRASRNN
jgi:hypothetical protein